jgi:hypothetical protein
MASASNRRRNWCASRRSRTSKDGAITRLPGMLANWTRFRDLPKVPAESFRQWWAKRKPKEKS